MKAIDSVATGQRSKERLLYDPRKDRKTANPVFGQRVGRHVRRFDVLFALVLGKGTDLLLETEKHEPRSVTIVNKFSGKALEVENSSLHQGVSVQWRRQSAMAASKSEL